MSAMDFTASGTEYTLTDAGSIQLGQATYTVQIQRFHNGDEMVWLTGVRGGVYFLRKFSGKDDGHRQVISWKSGKPLTVRGNEVRVIAIGDVIEKA
jgi:hypothetical protein